MGLCQKIAISTHMYWKPIRNLGVISSKKVFSSYKEPLNDFFYKTKCYEFNSGVTRLFLSEEFFHRTQR